MRLHGWDLVEPVIDPTVRQLCTRAYPGHRRGCPNYGRRPMCPPQAPLMNEERNPHLPAFVIWNWFDFGAHVERMRAKRPDWSERQLACCLYWQGTARKQLEEEIRRFSAGHPGFTVTRCPEAMGVNVTATMERVGITLQWPPRTAAYQVAVAYLRAIDADEEESTP